MTELNTMTVREVLVFYGITAAGTIQPREMFRFMESTGPQWWLPVSGMTRHEFWRSRKRTLVARTATIRILATGCRASDKITARHVITHGHRTRAADLPPEYGFRDFLTVARDSDGTVISELIVDTVWLDLGDGGPRVATTPPDGLNCPDEQLPGVEPMPAVKEAEVTTAFRWTMRETDVNGHVSFPSYYERAENAMADAGLPPLTTGTWQGWYRQECLGDQPMELAMQRTGDGCLFSFTGAGEHRARVVVRFTSLG